MNKLYLWVNNMNQKNLSEIEKSVEILKYHKNIGMKGPL